MTHTPDPQLCERLRQGVRREDCPLRVSPCLAHTSLSHVPKHIQMLTSV